MVHLKVHPTIPRLSLPPPRTLGIGFAARCVHAKPCLDCLCQSKRCPGTFRFAPLLPLTRLNWRPSYPSVRRLIGAVKSRSEASLDGLKLAKENGDKVLREPKCHQNRSQAFLAIFTVKHTPKSKSAPPVGGADLDGLSSLLSLSRGPLPGCPSSLQARCFRRAGPPIT
jgi:hypothetical protein